MTYFNRLALAFLTVTFLCVQLSCNNDDDTNDNSECDEVLCTLQFVTINVSIQDTNQMPIALDTYEVINLENGENIAATFFDIDFQTAQETGMYPIATDGIFLLNQEAEIQLRGFINDQEVVRSNYVVATDCCHINLVSGDTTLILE